MANFLLFVIIKFCISVPLLELVGWTDGQMVAGGGGEVKSGLLSVLTHDGKVISLNSSPKAVSGQRYPYPA